MKGINIYLVMFHESKKRAARSKAKSTDNHSVKFNF